MSDSISAIGAFLSSVEYMRNSQDQLQQLTQQNTTGTKSTALAGYGSAAPRILDLNASIAETRAWVANSTQVGTYLSAYDASLTQLSGDGNQLQQALETFGTGGATPADLQTLIQGLETDVTATLNTQVGDRFIYAGDRYGTAPVVDLNTLAAPSTPQAITLASGSTSPPTIPNYDTAYAATSPPGQVAAASPYYGPQQIGLAAGETMTYGVSSNDPAIQQLVYALKQAEAGAAASPPTSDQFLANARSAIASALSGLGTLSQQNAGNQSLVKSTQTEQNQAISTMQTQLGDLTQVDPATVATQLSAVENQLSATYKATASLLNLSLLNYLP